ncbi:Glucanosyltransferase-domain-containing protein [Mycena galopus ATCC 62051]|nr:Glucanosyltransferase-domain-containing protein [Mycena galopus ATCC 62051]
MTVNYAVVDQLADSAGCTRDLPFLQNLSVNAIRAYSVDSTLNHDSCMSTLSSAGIYVILDLTLPLNGSIDTTQPTWSTNLLDEVLTSDATNAAPFIKAAARDIKAYLASIGSSALVGYADIDGVSTFRDAVADYLPCDPTNANSGATSIDLFGLNNYERCGAASPDTYDSINTEFADYNVVAYFSEGGWGAGAILIFRMGGQNFVAAACASGVWGVRPRDLHGGPTGVVRSSRAWRCSWLPDSTDFDFGPARWPRWWHTVYQGSRGCIVGGAIAHGAASSTSSCFPTGSGCVWALVWGAPLPLSCRGRGATSAAEGGVCAGSVGDERESRRPTPLHRISALRGAEEGASASYPGVRHAAILLYSSSSLSLALIPRLPFLAWGAAGPRRVHERARSGDVRVYEVLCPRRVGIASRRSICGGRGAMDDARSGRKASSCSASRGFGDAERGVGRGGEAYGVLYEVYEVISRAGWQNLGLTFPRFLTLSHGNFFLRAADGRMCGGRRSLALVLLCSSLPAARGPQENKLRSRRARGSSAPFPQCPRRDPGARLRCFLRLAFVFVKGGAETFQTGDFLP